MSVSAEGRSDIPRIAGGRMASVGNLAFEALADATRRAIWSFLAAEGESPVGKIAAGVGTIGRTSVSSHLRVLRAADLVTHRKQGRFRLYSINPNPASELVEFLTGYAVGRARGCQEPLHQGMGLRAEDQATPS